MKNKTILKFVVLSFALASPGTILARRKGRNSYIKDMKTSHVRIKPGMYKRYIC